MIKPTKADAGNTITETVDELIVHECDAIYDDPEMAPTEDEMKSVEGAAAAPPPAPSE